MSVPIVDSHCHLDYADSEEARQAILARGRAAGIAWFVTVGVGRGTDGARDAIAMAEAERDVRATAGVHPHDAAGCTGETYAEMARMIAHEKVVAVGEVGLDYHYDSSPRDVQREVFRRFIALAKEAKKPLVIHTREAPADTLSILREEGARDVGGVIHCFSEDEAFARAAMDLDFDVSLSGIVTFKKAEAVRAAARVIPLDRLMIETDSPYLAPIPMRGKTN
ncbi:MAG: TatD family hydrolase, partial [Deltaproteobacteria bacterium]|nr:TatD family hydrolase [Deltaproteobacteria bacterium]